MPDSHEEPGARECDYCCGEQVVLQWQEGGEPSWGDCELPQLAMAAGGGPQKPLDMSGAVCFGDVSILERSGRVVPDPDAGDGAPAALNLCIKVQLQVGPLSCFFFPMHVYV